MNAHQMNVYQLAENLGMTVTRMKREMSLSEYFGWVAFYGERDDRQNGKPKAAKRPSPGSGIKLKGFDL